MGDNNRAVKDLNSISREKFYEQSLISGHVLVAFFALLGPWLTTTAAWTIGGCTVTTGTVITLFDSLLCGNDLASYGTTFGGNSDRWTTMRTLVMAFSVLVFFSWVMNVLKQYTMNVEASLKTLEKYFKYANWLDLARNDMIGRSFKYFSWLINMSILALSITILIELHKLPVPSPYRKTWIVTLWSFSIFFGVIRFWRVSIVLFYYWSGKKLNCCFTENIGTLEENSRFTNGVFNRHSHLVSASALCLNAGTKWG